MSFYDEMKAVADELLGPASEFAQGTLLLRRQTPGTGPAWDPGPPTNTDYPLSGVASGLDQNEPATLIAISDTVLTIEVPPVEPTLADKAVVDGLEWQIAKIDRIPKAGTAVAYKIYLKA